MLKVAELNSASAAQTFADYCHSQHWQVSVVVHSAVRAELFADAPQVAQVQQALEHFIAESDHPRYRNAAWDRNQPAAESGSLELGLLWSRMRRMAGPFTQTVTMLCVLVYLGQQIWPAEIYQQLKFFSPWEWQYQQHWLSLRWLTPALLHFSAAHLMFNLLGWWLFAGRIELKLGTPTLFRLLLVAGVISNTTQFLLQGDNFGGLSGVVYAVLGFVWVYGWRHQDRQLRLSHADIGIAVLFLALGFLDMLWVNTANWAHLAGLLSGVALGLLQRRK